MERVRGSWRAHPSSTTLRAGLAHAVDLRSSALPACKDGGRTAFLAAAGLAMRIPVFSQIVVDRVVVERNFGLLKR